MPDWNRPDWKKIVRERMASPNSPLILKEEVIAELAAHLEETCEEAQSCGLDASAALERTLQEVNDWHVLAAKIRRAKSKEDPMNARTKTLWLPALASLLGASLAMTLLQRVGVRPRLVWTGQVEMAFYVPWLALLPLFGASGAYLSRRAGGTVRTRVTASLAPVLWLLLLCILTEPLELASRGFSSLLYFGYGLAQYVAIPGIALLLGALPFLRESRAPERQPRTT